MEVSKHGEKRILSRVGGSKKSVDKIAQRAFEEGITHAEAKGNLQRWMGHIFTNYNRGNQMRIYGDKLYVFHKSSLITVVDVPRNLLPLVHKIAKEKKTKKQNTPSDITVE